MRYLTVAWVQSFTRYLKVITWHCVFSWSCLPLHSCFAPCSFRFSRGMGKQWKKITIFQLSHILCNIITVIGWSYLHGRKITFVWRRSEGRVSTGRKVRNEWLAATPLLAWRDNPVWKQLQVIASIHEVLVHMTCRSGTALCFIACGYPRAPGKEAPEGIWFNSPQTTKLVCTWLCYI